jgi:hypothetical protein
LDDSFMIFASCMEGEGMTLKQWFHKPGINEGTRIGSLWYFLHIRRIMRIIRLKKKMLYRHGVPFRMMDAITRAERTRRGMLDLGNGFFKEV